MRIFSFLVLYIIISCFNHNFLLAQLFEGKSDKVSLDIRVIPPDTTIPTIEFFNLREIAEGYPLYVKEREVTISGRFDDPVGISNALIDGKKITLVDKNKFQVLLKLKPGENKFHFKVFDRKKNFNEKELIIHQDDNADIQPPSMTLIEPSIIRGSQNLLKKGGNVKISFKANDDGKINEVLLNNQKIYPDSAGNYTYVLNTDVVDSASIRIIDSYGNYIQRSYYFTTREELAKLEDLKMDGKYYALIIAINDYADPGITSLDGPIPNAEALIKVLTSNYLFNDQNIVFLKNPKRKRIIQAFNELKQKVTPEDNLLIFYAGHGIFEKDVDQGYWLPSDAQRNETSEWISNGDIRDYIRGIKSKHTLLIADACFSGGIFKTRDVFTGATPSILETYKVPSRKALTSGSLKTVPDKSVFIEYLLKRLKENTEKFLTAEELYRSIKEPVTNNSPNNQVPMYGSIQGAGDEGTGDFIFIRK